MIRARQGDSSAISALRTLITERRPAFADANTVINNILRAIETGEQEIAYQGALKSLRFWRDRTNNAKNKADAVLALSRCFDELVAAKFRQSFGLKLESEADFTLESVIRRYNAVLSARYRELIARADSDLGALEALQQLFELNRTSRKQTQDVIQLEYPAAWNEWVITQHPAPPASHFDFSALARIGIEDMAIFAARAIQDSDWLSAMLWLRYREVSRGCRRATEGLVDRLALVASTGYNGRKRQPERSTVARHEVRGSL